MRTTPHVSSLPGLLAAFVLVGCSGADPASTGAPAPTPSPVRNAGSSTAPTMVSAPSAVPSPSTGPPSPAPRPKAPVTLILTGEGLRYSTGPASTAELPFGAPRARVVQLLEAAFGITDSTQADYCGPPVELVRPADGLGLSAVVEDGAFSGWYDSTYAGRHPTTANGVGVGSTRAKLDDAFRDGTVMESSLGQEFSTGDGGFTGLLSGAAQGSTVDYFSAGRSCVAR